ncbi:MAG: GTPase domain-containing protein [Candidatus Thorarchaeota archaeon]|nr:GTPase domain-containing protein [Candidatus Thorarchaeota archaeon]
MIAGEFRAGTQAIEKSSVLGHLKEERGIRKILVAGSGAVGKTTLIAALTRNQVMSGGVNGLGGYRRTLFLDLQTLRVHDEETSGNSQRTLQFLDVAGQLNSPIHPIRDTSRSTLGLVDTVLLVFASDSAQSLIDLRAWITLLETQCSSLTSPVLPEYVLVRNKTDLPLTVDRELVEVLRTRTHISHYFETSCATGEGIDELRLWLLRGEPCTQARGGVCTR